VVGFANCGTLAAHTLHVFYYNGATLGSAIVTNDLEKSNSWCYPYIVKESICITKIQASVIWGLKSVAFANG
jgi:hypothetical protein